MNNILNQIGTAILNIVGVALMFGWIIAWMHLAETVVMK